MSSPSSRHQDPKSAQVQGDLILPQMYEKQMKAASGGGGGGDRGELQNGEHERAVEKIHPSKSSNGYQRDGQMTASHGSPNLGRESSEQAMNAPEVVAQTPCGTIIKWEEMFEVCFGSFILIFWYFKDFTSLKIYKRMIIMLYRFFDKDRENISCFKPVSFLT